MIIKAVLHEQHDEVKAETVSEHANDSYRYTVGPKPYA